MAFDRSNNAHDVQYLGSPINRGVKKIDLTSGGQYLSIPDHDDFDFTGDFTIEVFGVEFSNVGTNKTVLCKGGSSPDWSWYIIKGTSGAAGLEFDYSFNGTAINALQGSFTPVVNTPYDICVDRSGTTLRLYVNGSMLSSTTASGAINNSPQALIVSRLTIGSTFAEGLIRLTGLRITNSVARYASDSGYTVPTLPLPTQ